MNTKNTYWIYHSDYTSEWALYIQRLISEYNCNDFVAPKAFYQYLDKHGTGSIEEDLTTYAFAKYQYSVN